MIGKISSMRVICQLFVIHTLMNALLLSSWNKRRIIFWERLIFTKDEKWIANWFAFGHFHVAILLAALCARTASADNDEYDYEMKTTKLSVLTVGIIVIYIAEGIFSIEFLDRRLVYLQLTAFASILFAMMYVSGQEQQQSPYKLRLRKLTSTSSFSHRKKIGLPTLVLGIQMFGSLWRLVDMVLLDGQNSYLGDMSSPVYQNISNMALCDMMIVTCLLGAAMHLFEQDQQKKVLWAQVVALMIQLAMLSSTSQGSMMDSDSKHAGGIGTFISVITAIIGAI